MRVEDVTRAIAVCKEKGPYTNGKLQEKVQMLFQEVCKVEFHYREHAATWEFWFEQEGQWFVFDVEYSRNRIRFMLNYSMIAEIGKPVSETELEPEELKLAGELLDWLTEKVREDIRLMEQGTYREQVVEKIPDCCRTGVLIKHNVPRGTGNHQGYVSGLAMSEQQVFRALKQHKYKLIVEPKMGMKLEELYRAYAEAAKKCGWPTEAEESDRDIFLRYAGESHTALLRDNPELSLDEWFFEYYMNKGMYNAVVMDKTVPVGINVCRDEFGYFFEVVCNCWDKMDDAVRFYLVMIAMELPVWLPNAEQYLDLLQEQEKIAIIPEICTCDNPAMLFPTNTFVSEYMSLKELGDIFFPLKVDWNPIPDLEPISEIGEAILNSKLSHEKWA